MASAIWNVTSKPDRAERIQKRSKQSSLKGPSPLMSTLVLTQAWLKQCKVTEIAEATARFIKVGLMGKNWNHLAAEGGGPTRARPTPSRFRMRLT